MLVMQMFLSNDFSRGHAFCTQGHLSIFQYFMHKRKQNQRKVKLKNDKLTRSWNSNADKWSAKFCNVGGRYGHCGDFIFTTLPFKGCPINHLTHLLSNPPSYLCFHHNLQDYLQNIGYVNRFDSLYLERDHLKVIMLVIKLSEWGGDVSRLFRMSIMHNTSHL